MNPSRCFAPIGSASEIDAGDRDLAGRRAQDPGDHAQRRRLAGAVGAEKAEQLAARHFEVDRVHRGEAAVALGEPAKADHIESE